MNSDIVELLRSIDRRLSLLTAPQERGLREWLVEEVLRTEARTLMYDAVDGRRGSPEIARAAGVTERAAQMFVKDMLEVGLLRVVDGASGRGILVEKDYQALVDLYLQR